jgi:hypothetical protein
MIGNFELFGSLQADHIRGGSIIETRVSAPRIPDAAKKNPSFYLSLKQFFQDPWAWYAHKLDSSKPMNLVTSQAVTDLVGELAAGAVSITAFNFHDSGTGTTNNTNDATHTLSGGSITNATPQVVTTPSAHGLTTNDIVVIAGVTGDTSANATWQITVNSTTTFTLIGSSAGGAATVTSATYQRVNAAQDTILAAQAGPTTRATGTQVNSGAGTPANPALYKSVGTINYTSSLAITEWGLFNQAAQGGHLWDRRWFNTAGAPAVTATAALVSAPINVVSGDSIQFSYSLSALQGGS